MSSRLWISCNVSPGGITLTKHEQVVFPRALADDVRPTYVTLIGRKQKATLLAEILATRAPLQAHNQICLWATSRFQTNRGAIVVIDSEVHESPCNRPMSMPPAAATAGPWKVPEEKHLGAALCDSILAPFSRVICYFASDLGGQRAVARWLALQAATRSSSDLMHTPRVLVVVDTTSSSFDDTRAESRIMDLISRELQSLQCCEGINEVQTRISCRFRDIKVLGFHTNLTMHERAQALKKRLRAMAARPRPCHSSFSVTHFDTLAQRALQHFCTNDSNPFSFVTASRPQGFSTEGFQACLLDCLGQIPCQTWLWHVVAPMVASALFLSCYPPRTHKFPPAFLFTKLFGVACRNAIIEYTIHKDVQDKFSKAVLAEFQNIFERHLTASESATEMHSQNLAKLHSSLGDLRSHKSCFCCFMRMPEKVLACGHALCDVCIKIYGRRSPYDKHTYDHPVCVLCGTQCKDLQFRFVPPTAGIRVLSLDGGGVRGIVPLIFLNHLQKVFTRFDCAIKDQFDLVCGTSAGGLVVIGMFLLQWSTEESLRRFEEVAVKTFRKTEGANLLTRAAQLLLAYIEDGKYKVSAIQEAFMVTFGSEIKMFNPLRNDTKVAVTTTASNSVARLFTNYNGGERPHSLGGATTNPIFQADLAGYDVVRADRPQHDVSVNDAACCTSAAPWFFKPHVVGSLGTFQDGGLQHNNPASIAQWETRFLWPKKGELDFLLSLGTGTSSPAATPEHGKRDPFYMRLFKTFMKSLDGEEAWRRFANTISPESRHRYHRLNLQFPGSEPQLDDVSSISDLKTQTLNSIPADNSMKGIVDNMLATMFYFELDEYPDLRNAKFQCSGFIFCRVELSVEGRRQLYNYLAETSSWFLVKGAPLACVDTIPQSLPPFKRRIKFVAESLEEVIAISIRGITSASRSISGFPTTLRKLVDAQQLECPFGTVDHRSREKSLPVLPYKRNGSGSHDRYDVKRAMIHVCT